MVYSRRVGDRNLFLQGNIFLCDTLPHLYRDGCDRVCDMEKDNETTGYIKKVVIIGPECTGKTTLARALAKHYNTTWVPEYARQYIDSLDRPYREEDLLTIANGQIIGENSKVRTANKLLICDTNLLVIKIWQEYKYGKCYQEILDQVALSRYDLYLLTYIDVPWENDPQRENPGLRRFFFDLFKRELETRDLKFIEVRGGLGQRSQTAIKAIDKLFDPAG